MAAIDLLEAEWADLMRLVGDLVVARSRGEPPEPWTSTRALARRYRAARRGFDARLAAAEREVSAAEREVSAAEREVSAAEREVSAAEREVSAAEREVSAAEREVSAAELEIATADRRALESIRACLPWFDELEPTPGVATPDDAVPTDPDEAKLRRTIFRRFGRAGAIIRLDGEVLDRLTVFARLEREPDPTARRRLFEALDPLWRSVDGDGDARSPYRLLLARSAARWRRTGSPIDANAAALGIDPGTVEPMLRAILGAWRRLLPPEPIEPWDYRFVCGAAARRLDPLAPLERLRENHDGYLVTLGADVDALGIGYDLFERDGRPVIPVAFAMGRGPEPDGSGGWRARSPWVFATYREGGLGSLGELLHETGHAIHDAAIRTRPAFFEFPLAMSAFLEGTADVLGFDADEPAWQARWLGEAASQHEALRHRYGSVMLDVCWALLELVLHREPDRRPNDVWAEITSQGLGVVPHPEWSWWAVRGQLIELPGYMANYAFSAILAAAVRSRLHELIGDWSTGRGLWYPTLTASLFQTGSERPPAELLRDFLGGPLTVEPLLADLARPRGMPAAPSAAGVAENA